MRAEFITVTLCGSGQVRKTFGPDRQPVLWHSLTDSVFAPNCIRTVPVAPVARYPCVSILVQYTTTRTVSAGTVEEFRLSIFSLSSIILLYIIIIFVWLHTLFFSTPIGIPPFQ